MQRNGRKIQPAKVRSRSELAGVFHARLIFDVERLLWVPRIQLHWLGELRLGCEHLPAHLRLVADYDD